MAVLVRCVLAAMVVMVVFPCVGQLDAQERAPHLYVVRAIGDWVVIEGRDTLSLRPLTRIAPGRRIGVRSPGRADTTFTLTLRDPRTLRTATWRCSPASGCRAPRVASELPFTGQGAQASSRASGLFVHLGDAPDTRSRVRVLGARGVAAADLGLMLVVADSGRLDVSHVLSRGERGGGDRVVRFCAIQSAQSAATCRDEADLRPDDCLPAAGAWCPSRATSVPHAAAILVFRRELNTLAAPAESRGAAVVVPAAKRAEAARLLNEYWRDLVLLRDQVTDAEFRALTAAAAIEIVRAIS